MRGRELRNRGPGVDQLASARVQPVLLIPEQAFKGSPRVLNNHQPVGRLPDEPGSNQ